MLDKNKKNYSILLSANKWLLLNKIVSFWWEYLKPFNYVQASESKYLVKNKAANKLLPYRVTEK